MSTLNHLDNAIEAARISFPGIVWQLEATRNALVRALFKTAEDRATDAKYEALRYSKQTGPTPSMFAEYRE
jgi:hypothetical protein